MATIVVADWLLPSAVGTGFHFGWFRCHIDDLFVRRSVSAVSKDGEMIRVSELWWKEEKESLGEAFIMFG